MDTSLIAADHDQRAIDTLRGDVAHWRSMTLAAIDQLRESERTVARLREQLADERATWARCAERLIDVE